MNKSRTSETNGHHNRIPNGSCCNGLRSTNGSDRQSTDKTVTDAVHDKSLSELNETDPMLRPICPEVLVEIARICNPF
jgi:hypothetical protein